MDCVVQCFNCFLCVFLLGWLVVGMRDEGHTVTRITDDPCRSVTRPFRFVDSCQHKEIRWQIYLPQNSSYTTHNRPLANFVSRERHMEKEIVKYIINGFQPTVPFMV